MELAIQKFNSTETIPSWFINMELELSQFLFDCAIYLRKKEYNEYIIPLERLSKLKLIKPKTLGQALRIDGVTPAAVIILLGAIKKAKHRVPA